MAGSQITSLPNKMNLSFFLLCILINALKFGQCGMLYPRDSTYRTVFKSLNGMWNFRVDDSVTRNIGFQNKWFQRPLVKTGPVIPMPVPASYNDITQNKSLRDFVGWAWYDREFYFPSEMLTKRIVLRVDSAHYYSIVWVNGQEVTRHVGGHLPFEVELNNSTLKSDVPNLITIAVNNTLTPTTLPPGTIEYKTDPRRYPKGYFVQNLQMDFFNYAGIHRSVKIYATPRVFIDDITIVTDIQGNDGIVRYTINTNADSSIQSTSVKVKDKDGNVVGSGSTLQGQIFIQNAKFWWPYSMDISNPAYMYSLEVTTTSSSGEKDMYIQPFGIRTVSVTDTQLLINNKPFYCHGVAKHEDSDIRGKGLDFPLIAKDFNLLKWLGANCIRTSHYPYAEEIMDQADQQGIVVIDESPGVGIRKRNNFGNASLDHHMNVMAEMVQRDKNRPAVIMWSIANEPDTTIAESVMYFKTLLSYTKKLDPTRLVTYVANSDYSNDLVAQYADVLCINRYYAWYSDCSHTELIQLQLDNDLRAWHQKFNKPIIIAEYGADTVAGFHQDPSFVFTEEFQVEFMNEYHKAFDSMRDEFLVGEMVWNFADFMTVQQITRVVGNKKGVFTRQRQPKMSAHILRNRYQKMINSTETHTYIGVVNHYDKTIQDLLVG